MGNNQTKNSAFWFNEYSVPKWDTSVLIGKTLEYAKSKHKDIRVLKQDGQGEDSTDDLDSGRLNVEIENGIITKISGWY